MGLKTRLDPRSVDNRSFQLVHSSGTIYAEITLINLSGTLEIDTLEDLFITKPNGYTSSRGRVSWSDKDLPE